MKSDRVKSTELVVFGHRGSGSGAGENTLDSITRALDAGAAGVEVDARRTRDGRVVLAHEPVVDGLTIIDTDYERLAERGVALLTDALELARGRGRVIVEVKNQAWEPDFDAPDEATVAALVPLLAEADDVVVSSFDFYAAEAARDAGLRCGFLSMPGVRPAAAIAYAADASLDEVHVWVGDVLGEPRCVEAAAAAGLALVAWTAHSVEQLDALRDLGVPAAISDVIA